MNLSIKKSKFIYLYTLQFYFSKPYMNFDNIFQLISLIKINKY